MTRCNSLRNAYRFLLGFDIGRIFIFFIFYKFNLVNIWSAFVCKRLERDNVFPGWECEGKFLRFPIAPFAGYI